MPAAAILTSSVRTFGRKVKGLHTDDTSDSNAVYHRLAIPQDFEGFP